MIQIKFVEEAGHEAVVNAQKGELLVVPLGVNELRRYLLEGAPLPIVISGAEVALSGPEHNFDGQGDVSFCLLPKPLVKVFGLTEGGWLPVFLVQANYLLPDQNVAKKFPQFSRELARSNLLPDGLEHLDRAAKHIHPMLIAIEGNTRQFPSLAEMSDEVRQVAARLQQGMPNQSVFIPTDESILGAYRIVEERRQRYPRDAEFLTNAYPFLANRVKDANLVAVHDALERLADKLGLARSSFLYMLTLDCLYDNHPVKKEQESPGRAVLKPRVKVLNGDIYNALFDVWQMEFLIQIHRVPGTGKVAICTMDKGLAQAWAMFRPRNFEADERFTRISVSIPDEFALRMPPDRRNQVIDALQN
ncbi:MAG: hypothetical protein WBK19_05895 [Azonexus sp.]